MLQCYFTTRADFLDILGGGEILGFFELSEMVQNRIHKLLFDYTRCRFKVVILGPNRIRIKSPCEFRVIFWQKSTIVYG